jgi:class 3 adenylate cyclase
MTRKYHYNSLEDFLATNPLSVDGQVDDGGGVRFPVKGREIETTILFSDISGFSRRTLHLSPTETLIFVNHFFTWISAEALQNRPGIVDKYIGDEIMVVFSKEFGSSDPFADAVQTARRMCSYDPLDFDPHIGIASGPVTVGYVGTPIRYNCSVFGAAVALASRCASVKSEEGDGGSRMVFPASEWGSRRFEDLFPPRTYQGPDGGTVERPTPWELLPSRKVEMKNIGDIEVREARRTTTWVPHGFSAEQAAKEALQTIRRAGRYWGSDGGSQPQGTI